MYRNRMTAVISCILLTVFFVFPGLPAAAETQAVSLAAGQAHTLVLTPYGRVMAAGDNENGECDTWGWTDIVSVSAGRFFSAGARADGSVVLAGQTDGMDVSSWHDIVSVAAGEYFLAGLSESGTVYITGVFDEAAKTEAESWTNICTIAAGYKHLVAQDENGIFHGAGQNSDGQCNLSSFTSYFNSGNTLTRLTAGDRCTLAVFSDGALLLAGITMTEGGLSLPANVVDAAVGDSYILAVKADGTVYTNASHSPYTSFTSNIRQIVIGYGSDAFTHIVAQCTDGTLQAKHNSTSVQAPTCCEVSALDPTRAPLAPFDNTAQQLYPLRRSLLARLGDGTFASANSTTFPADEAALTALRGACYIACNANVDYFAAVYPDGSVYTNSTNASYQEAKDWSGMVKVAISSTHILGLRWDGKVLSTLTNDKNPDVENSSASWQYPCRDIAVARNTSVGLSDHGIQAFTNTPSQVTLYAATFRLLQEGNWSNVTSLLSGVSHIVGQTEAGTYTAAGQNTNGECNIDAWTDIRMLALSDVNTFGLRQNGTVCWAGGTSRYIDYQKIAAWKKCEYIGASSQYVVALREDGHISVSACNLDSIKALKATAESWDYFIKRVDASLQSVTRQDSTVSLSFTLTGQAPFADCRIIAVLYNENRKKCYPLFIAPQDVQESGTDYAYTVKTRFAPCEIAFLVWEGLSPCQSITYFYDGGTETWMRK